MHICFLTHEYPKTGYPHGGVGTFVRTLAQELVKKGIEVSVVGINYIEKVEVENDNGVTIYRCKSQKMKGLTWLTNALSVNRKINEIHKQNPIDVVEGSELSLAFIKKIKGVKYIIRMHGGHHFFAEAENRGINKWKGFQEKLSFKKADKIIGVGQYVMDHTANYIDYLRKRGPVIYNPANFEKFFPADSTKIEKGRLFFAGTICEKKGIRQLIMAMPLIKQQFTEVELYIAGRDWHFPDGSSYTTYLKTFIDNSVKDNIVFLGQVLNDDIPGLIEKSEACVYPSHMEAMPLAWIEVLAMGKAFIGSSTGPGPEVVTDGITGLLCNPHEPADIAEKVIFMLKNKEKAKEMGRNARLDILKRFNLNFLVEKNIEFYKSLL